jgi:hypothetical protein
VTSKYLINKKLNIKVFMCEYLISSLYLVLMETTIEASTVNSSSDLPILENVCGDANNAHDSFKSVTGYYDSDMSFEKIIELQKLAETGDLEAQHHLAFCYEMGIGIKENDQEAMKLYTASANAGYVHSIFKMGVQYEEGQCGVEQNDKKAIEYYVLAGNAGSVDACYNLAECYRYGEMVEQDYQKALEYYITSHIKNRTFASSYSFFKYSIYLKKCIYTVFKKRITAGKSSILNMISNKRDIVRY